MKAFQFRLDQVMRWRSTQLDIEKGRLAATAAKLDQLRQAAHALKLHLTSETASQATGTEGASLAFRGAWETRTLRQIAELKVQQAEAAKALGICVQAVAAADQRLRLLQNLRKKRHAHWQTECDRELESFAAESFLGKLQLENGRARSSSG